VILRDMDDAIVCAKSMFTGARHRIVPVFLVSNTKGEGLDLLKSFFNLLPKVRDFKEKMDQPFSTFIDEVFSVTGVGTVVAGTVLSGGLEVNQQILLGPFDDGSFRKVRVKSIHYKRTPVRRVIAGQTAAFALHRVKREEVRKGQVLLSQEYGPEAVSEFEANCMILYHKTTIKRGYQAVIHCNTIKQTARILWMNKKYLRTGDRATILFQFISRPEYIVPGMRFVFREGRTKGIGVITHIKRKA
ncbi:MAG: EF-Tu/IF-2/RF-3 family GTPase, partial [Asgard group archaeon]